MHKIIETTVVPVFRRYYDHKSSRGIYRCEVIDSAIKSKLITIKGSMMELEIGTEYLVRLREDFDKKWGMQYEVESIFEDIPKDINKQRFYLLTILTQKQVDAIYNTYPNTDIIELIRKDEFDYNKVHGVGVATYERIKNKIIENVELQKAFEFLSGFGVTNNAIMKLVRHFRSSVLLIQEMMKNPYCITAVGGFGFKSADVIAMKMGYAPKGKFRIESAIEHIVKESIKQGSTYIEVFSLIDKVHELLTIDTDLITPHVKETDRLTIVQDRVTLKAVYHAEEYITKRLLSLVEDGKCGVSYNVDKFIKEQENKLDIKLTHQQKSFFTNFSKYNINCLVGNAGSGKSNMTKLVISLLEELGLSYRLVSPTAKAAKVLTNYTERPAETIHRAIGMGRREEDGFETYIEEEVLIVDEFSMVDVLLCQNMLKKCTHENLKVVFIGDDEQLASVGPGRILHDIMKSDKIPVTKLDVIFRQKEGGIIDIATKMRKGESFLRNSDWGIKKFGNDCTIACVPQEKIEGGYKYFFKQLLKKYSHEEITIATPTWKGSLGVTQINNEIQEIVNPPSSNKNEILYGDNVVFREGDIVMNTKNDDRLHIVKGKASLIVNGDDGKITHIDKENRIIHVDFGFAVVEYEKESLAQLTHSWAQTVHKLQGSSNKAVIVIADKAHKFQMNGNLLYVAATRPTEELIILSQSETINSSLRKKANLQRNTFLFDMLVEGIN
ncbi:AAA family ATPase [Siminovitchia fordii]|uniref:Exodeoxyribonuclease V subunit alpha n=1 Tax=Siminovitchia fordii TaxID=254759 RepID=A0ABQ4KC81_9BACI|nr:AAA family ATPase [Siminovitchia fordii]GIN22637.1 exodeoxyribonuclease V subunit alpha [Siminovitchia fordii]